MQGNDLRHGLALFNGARFFEAHEALEDLWREAPRHSPLRRHLQGLVQLAVAFHHQSTGNRTGARSLLERAFHNLDGAEESFRELDLKRLRTDLMPWREHLSEGRPGMPSSSHPTGSRSQPRLPKITLRDHLR
jgi:uncharacterized protein